VVPVTLTIGDYILRYPCVKLTQLRNQHDFPLRDIWFFIFVFLVMTYVSNASQQRI